MDSDDSEDELYPVSEVNFNRVQIFEYDDPFLLTGILRATVEGDLKKIQDLVSNGHSLNINDNNGNTPLHVAVVKKNMEILSYLAEHEDIRINTRNFMGQTPLYLAVRSGQYELTKILLDNGANVNLPDNEDVTPLHRAVQYPNIAHLLIKHGANINAIDYSDDAPLHDAVAENCLETVCMLLYYGADANALGGNNLTPFMKAIITENLEMQEALIDYVDDFNVTTLDSCSTLNLALTHENPFVEEIIKRGAEVNVSAYRACINIPNVDNFKLVWSYLTPRDMEDEDVNLMVLFYELDKDIFQEYVDIIIENTGEMQLQVLAQKTNSRDLASLIDKCADNFLTSDQITKLVLIWLQHGFEINSDLIVQIYFKMGYCELLKILLFIDYIEDWTPALLTPRIIFDIHNDIKVLYIKMMQNTFIKTAILDSLHYCNWKYLYKRNLNAKHDDYFRVLNTPPALPSLLELARDQTRKYIVNKFKMQRASQYYTYINCLDISIVYKQILMYERKIYP